MPFQVSPGINVSEIDLTAVVPAVSTTTAAIAGHFRWGPVNKATLISSEDALVSQFNKPNADTSTDFFTAANFLSYGNALYVARAENSTMSNAHCNAANTSVTRIDNSDDYENNHSSGTANIGRWVAKYPGALGNSLKVSVCSSAAAYEATLSGTFTIAANTTAISFSANQSAVLVAGDLLKIGEAAGVKQTRRISTVAANGTSATLESAYTGIALTANASLTRTWEYAVNTERAPGTSAHATKAGASADEVHVAVIDEDGLWTGTKGQVLEVFESMSMASDGKTETGSNNYYVNVLNNRSRYIHWAASTDVGTNVGTSVVGGTTYAGSSIPLTDSLVNGSDGAAPTAANVITAYDKFKSAEDIDVSFILGSGNGQTVATHIIDNIAASRRDCLVVLSPTRGAAVNNSTYEGKEQEDIIAYRDSLPSTSYATMDSGWKYQYDKYNDMYRYVPANGDTAGLMVRTDSTNDPWYSPAGFNRGNMKNVIKLAYNPSKADRDELYKKGINPVVTFPGKGTILYGDKTLLSTPSAFDRINVRRLFIVLEKAITLASQSTLFEFNDAFTRAQFKNLVEPFLRDVQGRRGITDFKVVCDGTNNTGEVIDRNEFIGDIYIKPARSINFIQLNFVAVRTGVEFSEIVGQV